MFHIEHKDVFMKRSKPFAEMSKRERLNYNQCVEALYGKNVELSTKNVQLFPKKPRSNEEYQEQVKFCAHLRKEGIKHYAIPNGGRRNPIEGAKLKAMGVSRGVPDICLPYPTHNSIEPYHGLYIEFKRMSGSITSPEQKEWIEFLNNQGYVAKIAHSCEEAKEILDWYFSLLPKAA